MITSEVKGVKIEMSLREFSVFTGLDYKGAFTAGVGEESEWIKTFDKEVARLTLLEYHSPEGRLSAMHVQDRLLQYALSRILVPRSGNHAILQNNDILLLWALIQKKQLSWGYIIAKNMYERKLSGGALPYAGLVVKLLKKFGVSLDGEERHLARHVTKKFGEGTIKQMALIYADNVWKRSDIPAATETPNTRQRAADDQLLHEKFDRLMQLV